MMMVTTMLIKNTQKWIVFYNFFNPFLNLLSNNNHDMDDFFSVFRTWIWQWSANIPQEEGWQPKNKTKNQNSQLFFVKSSYIPEKRKEIGSERLRDLKIIKVAHMCNNCNNLTNFTHLITKMGLVVKIYTAQCGNNRIFLPLRFLREINFVGFQKF